ncbi:EcsC family protein [Pontibacillus salipaludis]|uniref:ABC transporter-associated protein EcsC n=1 Tax=Pontibacillus salipaludis TaxID=1697394 RepID=A0ABQ1QFL4_9BACI|nr:EcsC family protein [Pontibacillus salipaludis]GGD23965.1 ABC transporter-associated protein EcsC [Pontibacillus salipaludis]
MRTPYEERKYQEALRFVKGMEKRSSIVQRKSKVIQTTMNNWVPERIHKVVSGSVKQMIELSLTGSHYIYPIQVKDAWTLKEREEQVEERLKYYKRTAALEGAGTGAGGIVLGVADFPLLLSIKMKFLFDTARIYGFSVEEYEERLFVLHVFMLAFSSDEKRKEVLRRVLNWSNEKETIKDVDWKTLQLEYRDSIDFVKMLQLIPGFGAFVGAWANTKLLEQLAETAQNAYRLRLMGY